MSSNPSDTGSTTTSPPPSPPAPTARASRKLTLDDIADMRAYERERAEFRERIIALKQRRRLHLGTVVTMVFENRETMRFQIQEMARVERLVTDEAIQAELDVYNPMVPEAGQLCATLFLELTDDDQLREWLPRLVGIEAAVLFRLPNGDEVRSITESQHASQLTREEVTAAVHYVRFEFTLGQVAAFRQGPVRVAIDHPAYEEEIELLPDTVSELLTDLVAE